MAVQQPESSQGFALVRLKVGIDLPRQLAFCRGNNLHLHHSKKLAKYLPKCSKVRYEMRQN